VQLGFLPKKPWVSLSPGIGLINHHKSLKRLGGVGCASRGQSFQRDTIVDGTSLNGLRSMISPAEANLIASGPDVSSSL
jgi:hypothetical protein